MDALKLRAVLGLDKTEYDQGLNQAEATASKKGGGIGNILAAGVKVAGAAIAAASTAVAGFAAVSVKTGMEFDKSMSQVAATMGKTVDEISELRDYAQEMGRTTMFSASQAADALNYMALAGYDAETSMKMLPNVLNLAAAGNMDLAAASDMVTDAQSALGLSLEQTEVMVDQMAKTSSKTNTSVSQLGEAILTIGATARGVAGGTQELNAVLGVLADNGIKGAEGGTHLRNAILSLQTPSDKGAIALEKLNMSYEDMYDSAGNMRSLPDIFLQIQNAMEGMTQQSKDAIISGIFNKTDLAAINALIGTDAERWSELANEIKGAWYSIEFFNDQMSSISVNMDDVLPKFDQMGISQEEFEKALGRSEGNVNAFIESLLEFGNEGLETNDILDAMGTDLRHLDHAFQGVTGSAEQMAKTQMDNLAGDITYFKSALEGAQVAISDELSPGLREFVQFGTDGLSRLTAAFKLDGIDGAMKEFGNLLSEGLTMIIDMLPDVIDAGMKLLGALGKGLLDNLPVIIDAAIQIIMALATGLIQALPQIIQGAFQIITGLAGGLIQALPQLIPALIDTVLTIVEYLTDPANLTMLIEAAVQIILALVDGLIQALPRLIEALPMIVENVVTALINNLPLLIEATITIVMAIAQAIIENLPLLLAAAVQIIFALINGLISALPELLTAVMDLSASMIATLLTSLPKFLENGAKLVGSIIKGIVSMIGKIIEAAIQLITNFIKGFKDQFTKVTQAGKDMIDAVKNGISQKIEDAKNWGKDLIQNFIDGILEKWNALKETVSNVANTVKDYIGFSEPKEGPLSNFHTYAPDMIDLFIKGIKDNESKLMDAVGSAFDFENLITGTELAIAGEGFGGIKNVSNTYNININRPVKSPSDVAKAIREEAQYGLIGGGNFV